MGCLKGRGVVFLSILITGLLFVTVFLPEGVATTKYTVTELNPAVGVAMLSLSMPLVKWWEVLFFEDHIFLSAKTPMLLCGKMMS
jgi:hypothetical protein